MSADRRETDPVGRDSEATDQEALRVVNEFDSEAEAQRYSSEFSSRRQLRSRLAVERALEAVPRGASVLDLPCGTGRLLPLLVRRGYRYTGADVSLHMVESSRRKWHELQREDPSLQTEPSFVVDNIMSLGFADESFDAVVVNRLLHHYALVESRVAALREAGRVSQGPVIVSFSSLWTWKGVTFRLRHLFSRRKHRVPISLREMTRNAAAAGLEVDAVMPTRGRWAKECYVMLRRRG